MLSELGCICIASMCLVPENDWEISAEFTNKSDPGAEKTLATIRIKIIGVELVYI